MFLYDPTREKAILENSQIFQNCKLKIIFPLFMRKANAARIPNRPYSKEGRCTKYRAAAFLRPVGDPYIKRKQTVTEM